MSLRYLYKSPEKHEFRPEEDDWATATLTNESAKEQAAKLGVTGEGAAIGPNVELHFQSNKSVSVEREDMLSWRRGVSQEHCKYQIFSTVPADQISLFNAS